MHYNSNTASNSAPQPALDHFFMKMERVFLNEQKNKKVPVFCAHSGRGSKGGGVAAAGRVGVVGGSGDQDGAPYGHAQAGAKDFPTQPAPLQGQSSLSPWLVHPGRMSAGSACPEVALVDHQTGEEVSLSSIVGNGKPTVTETCLPFDTRWWGWPGVGVGLVAGLAGLVSSSRRRHRWGSSGSLL